MSEPNSTAASSPPPESRWLVPLLVGLCVFMPALPLAYFLRDGFAGVQALCALVASALVIVTLRTQMHQFRVQCGQQAAQFVQQMEQQHAHFHVQMEQQAAQFAAQLSSARKSDQARQFRELFFCSLELFRVGVRDMEENGRRGLLVVLAWSSRLKQAADPAPGGLRGTVCIATLKATSSAFESYCAQIFGLLRLVADGAPAEQSDHYLHQIANLLTREECLVFRTYLLGVPELRGTQGGFLALLEARVQGRIGAREGVSMVIVD